MSQKKETFYCEKCNKKIKRSLPFGWYYDLTKTLLIDCKHCGDVRVYRPVD